MGYLTDTTAEDSISASQFWGKWRTIAHPRTSVPPLPETVCPHCGTIASDNGAHPFDSVGSAVIDHILTMEAELAELRWLFKQQITLSAFGETRSRSTPGA